MALGLGCGDQYRPVANPIVGQGGQPQATHYAFVVNSSAGGNSSAVQLDVSGDTNCKSSRPVRAPLQSLFLAGNTSALFTANSLADSLERIRNLSKFRSGHDHQLADWLATHCLDHHQARFNLFAELGD